MKRKVTVFCVLATIMAFLVGCGGSNDVPRSSPSYAGPNTPAVLDSTTETQNLGMNFLWAVTRATRQFGGGAILAGTTTSSTDDYVEGGDGGSYTYSGSHSISWDATHYGSSAMQSLVFNDFADSSGVYISYSEDSGAIRLAVPGARAVEPLAPRGSGLYFEDLQAGRGSLYRKNSFSFTTDGIGGAVPNSVLQAIGPEGSGPVGRMLTDSSVFYSNYDAYFTSEGYPYDGYSAEQRQVYQSGYGASDMGGAYDADTGFWSFEDTMSADYAMDYFYSYSSDSPYQETYRYTMALLGFTQIHAWDLSTATFTSSGTFCAEGDTETYVKGCLAFAFSLAWEEDASGDPAYCRGTSNPIACYGQPENGTITLQAAGATASYALTPGGTLFTFDAGNGSGVFQTVLPPFDGF